MQTYFHLLAIDNGFGGPALPHPTASADLYFDGAAIFADSFTSFAEYRLLIEDQMRVLNDSFSETPFVFALQDISLYVNETWTRYPETYGKEISEALGFPDLKALNVYLVYNAGGLGSSEDDDSITVGFATSGMARAESRRRYLRPLRCSSQRRITWQKWRLHGPTRSWYV